MHFKRDSHLQKRLIIRALIAYAGALSIIALAVIVSVARGAGWRPALAGMPLYLTILSGITYQFVKEWRSLDKDRSTIDH